MDETVRRMTVGFLFSYDLKHVVLLRKERPSWQKGKLSGPGGKVEKGERPLQAMAREFCEETSLDIEESNWKEFAQIEGPGWIVHMFCSTESFERISEARTMEDEKVMVCGLPLPEDEYLPNIPWLILLACDFLRNPNGPVFTSARYR